MNHLPWQKATPPLVLASGSVTRRMLLELAGLAVETQPADIDEEAVRVACAHEGRSHGEIALELATLKASRISGLHPDALVIGADQVLSADGRMWGKPADLVQARRQLAALRGREHTLHTAAVLARSGRIVWRHLASPRLTMGDVSDTLLDLYIAAEGEALLSTVGACRIEGPGQLLFERAEGEHAAILGLPLQALLAELRRLDILIA